MKTYAERMALVKISHNLRTLPSYKPSNVKDIKAGKCTGNGPDMRRVNLKTAQGNSKKRPITLPKT